ncbi:TIGR01906 family membrane protein [Sporolactobacillus kofuensis]|uniref:TIGR01906 family membrane protein n=1 Tax=Sporolactobacillus kofuensis TaxID=269672 RepID=A0ABW1W9C1_9BACL
MSFSAYRFLQFLLSLCMALFIICSAIQLTLLFTPLYYLDVWFLDIAKQSGMDRTQIIENYRYMIHYLLNPLPQTFDLPSIPYSNPGRIHFQDVKHLFFLIDLILVVTGVFSAIGIWIKRKYHDYYYLRTAALLLTVFTILPLVAFAIDFNGTFILFHKLFFRNNYWIFDAQTDPVINILPETFFLHAALLILGLIAVGIITLLLIYRKKTR